MISILKRRIPKTLLTLVLIAFTPLSQLHAQELANPDEAKVEIRLLAEKGQVAPNEEIWVAIEQSIAPQWHTYWKNPGDSGTPTNIKWTLPEGFEIDEIQWPTPNKIPYGPLLNYGYENNVILLQKLKTPANFPEGPIELTADLEILVCKEECIPEYGTYTLSLNGENAQNEDNAAYIIAARKRLPVQTDWSVLYSEDGNDLILSFEDLAPLTLSETTLKSVEFFPVHWGAVLNPSDAQASLSDNKNLVIKQKRGERPLSEIETLNGVISFRDDSAHIQSFAFSAESKTDASPVLKEEVIITQNSAPLQITFLTAIGFALLGGLILNLMPCVFPVLSIKALSLIKTAEKNPAAARMHGIAYTLGVVISFVAIAGLLIALKTAGAQIGWGFQLQNPLVVGLLAYLLFILGLNLSGFFEFANPFANTGGKLTQNNGLSGSFFTGVLATIVATPCTAPFMAGAISYALVQPAALSLTIFAALGFGLALPYLLLSFIPAFQKALPRPGAWMDVFKQLLAFPMYGAAIWLVWVLGQQTGESGIAATLVGMLLIAFAIWLYKHKPVDKFWRGFTKAFTILAIIFALLSLPMTPVPLQNNAEVTKEFGETFSQGKLDMLLEQSDAPVFVEMTAAWCITCKLNHATSINIDSTKALFAKNNVNYLVGDWTNQDPLITQYLDVYGRKGVPLYVFYGAKDPQTKARPDAKILPQILTPQIVENMLKKPK